MCILVFFIRRHAEMKRGIMMPVRYAIVIVTYNRVRLLRECIAHAEAQTVRAHSIIVVDNASTDDTAAYLGELDRVSNIEMIRLQQNIGGAGGFAKGMERALQKHVDCVLLIDDDAMIEKEYMEKILTAREHCPQYRAFAGTVEKNERIDTFHRRDLLRAGLLSKNVPAQKYCQSRFECDIASFCGMVVDSELIRKIGLPHEEYFICYDDTEYSLRISRYSRFLVIADAVLDHKSEIHVQSCPRRYDWKDYYAIRNRILMVKEHGNIVDEAVNFLDVLVHSVFRNWLFGLIRLDHYDWKYERSLVKAAIKDSGGAKPVAGKVSGSVYVK